MTDKTIHTYSRIDAGIVAGIHMLQAGNLEKIQQQDPAGLQNRIFINTTDDYPPGSPLQIDISIPEKGVFRLTGITEYASGKNSTGDGQGVGVRLVEMIDIGEAETGENSSDPPGSTAKDIPMLDKSVPVDSATTVLPDAAAISELLGSLLDMNVKVDDSPPMEIDSETPKAICTFSLDDGRIKALWVCDLAMVINIGAGLAVIPPEVATTNINSGEIPDNIRENFQEVLNVSASLFNRPNGPHLSLGTLVITPDPITDDIRKALSDVSGRRDLRAIIPDYGDGLMSLIETDAK